MRHHYALTIVDIGKKGYESLVDTLNKILEELGLLVCLDRVLENSPKNNTLHYHCLVQSHFLLDEDTLISARGYKVDIRPITDKEGWIKYMHKGNVDEQLLIEHQKCIQDERDWIRRSKRGKLFTE